MGSIILQALLSVTYPIQASAVALAMSFIALSIDGYRWKTGQTRFWPKVVDLSLFLLWAFLTLSIFTALPEFDPVSKFFKLWGGFINTTVLAVISFVSCLVVKGGWCYQVAVDKQTDPKVTSSDGFKSVCKDISLLWGGLFILMAAGNALNVATNMSLDEDYNLQHDSDTINYTLGVGWGIIVVFAGKRATKVLVLKRKNAIKERAAMGG